MKINLTNHAINRAAERFGWSSLELEKQAILSINIGISCVDDEFLQYLFLDKGLRTNAIHYLLKGIIFVFCNDKLVTLYPITGYGNF